MKPKLDRFILTKLGSGNYEAGIKVAEMKNWLVGNGKIEHVALEYKMKLNSSNRTIHKFDLGYPEKKFDRNNGAITGVRCKWNEQFPNYFGNMSNPAEKKEPKHFTHSFEDLDNEVISTNKFLIQEVKKYLVDFFFNCNFGTRQDKGFGSFTIGSINGKEVMTNFSQPYFEVSVNEQEEENLAFFPRV
ncbi:MAG: hypothetical protein SGI83_10955, partial [Bacteroidota bacterium]|nr:hypothetical protein [Bacteroidota bacterium]